MRVNYSRIIIRFILRHRMLIMLIAILMLLIIYPFVQNQSPQIVVSIEMFFTLFLIAGINAVSQNKKIVTVSLLLAMMSFTIIWFDYFLHNPILITFGLCVEILFFIIITVTIISHVLKYKKVSADKIYGAICGYLLIGIIWSMIYTVIELSFPNSFYFANGLNLDALQTSTHRLYFSQFIYFSYITLSTLGYGDIVPIGLEARAFTSIQAIIGQLYVAILIARLVGLHISHTLLNKRD